MQTVRECGLVRGVAQFAGSPQVACTVSLHQAIGRCKVEASGQRDPLPDISPSVTMP